MPGSFGGGQGGGGPYVVEGTLLRRGTGGRPMAGPTEVRLGVIERETGQQPDYVGAASGRVIVPYTTGLKIAT